MDNVLKEFTDYLEVYENMTFNEAESSTNNLKQFVANCLKTVNINILQLKTHQELKLTMRAYQFINRNKNKQERLAFHEVSEQFNQYLLHKTVMEWL
ncbi:hypothetical protein [Lacinutrix sp. 5H-3-7-4]|uniref:hypothetical protein n=1 Tax=Lacinutrix sp. (strain 5H-3-7-4) TaxID=983544 RepID=UPI00020A3C1B|nr:hypothetical protein [Lacinutrix sp. 5H-3-7-4]AEH01981.1 hypothetical protein Lacal_2135 [Lacinutrix sp. 5H-3-7-4]